MTVIPAWDKEGKSNKVVLSYSDKLCLLSTLNAGIERINKALTATDEKEEKELFELFTQEKEKIESLIYCVSSLITI